MPSVDNAGEGSTPRRSIFESMLRSAGRAPTVKAITSREWPNLTECMCTVKTTDGKPRAGGEIKIVAVGARFRATMVMPEEGLQLSVITDDFGAALSALELAMQGEDAPWVECSTYALRRAKRRADKAKENSGQGGQK